MRASGKRSASAITALASSGAGSTPPLSLKSAKPYRALAASASRTTASGDSASSWRMRSHSSAASSVLVGRRPVRQIGLGAVADEEQVAERLHPVALLAVAEQRRHRHVEVLAEQIEQGGLDGGHRVHRDAQVERLRPASAGVAVAERAAHVVEHGAVVADAAAGDDRPRILQRAPDRLAAGHLTDAGVAVGVGDDHQVPGEERAVRAAEVQQHAVVAGDRDHRHLADDRNTSSHSPVTHDANHLSPLASGRTTRVTLSPMARRASTISRSRCGVSRSTGTDALMASCAGLQ